MDYSKVFDKLKLGVYREITVLSSSGNEGVSRDTERRWVLFGCAGVERSRGKSPQDSRL